MIQLTWFFESVRTAIYRPPPRDIRDLFARFIYARMCTLSRAFEAAARSQSKAKSGSGRF